MFREGLADSLAKDPKLKVVGQCSSAAEALPLLKSGQPTMILLDSKGNVLNRNVHISELDSDLKAQFK